MTNSTKRQNILFSSVTYISLALFCSVVLFFLTAWIRSLSLAFSFDSHGSFHFSSIFRNLLYTLAESFLSVLIALITGLTGAYFTSKKHFFGKKLLLSFSAIPLCIPSIIVALGYISSFGMSGTVNSLLKTMFHLKEPPLHFLYSFWGIVICQGFYNFPLVMMIVGNFWSKLNEDEENTARILGAKPIKIFFHVTLPKLSEAILSSAIPIFLFCYFSFMIVQLFGSMDGTTLEVSIFHAGRSTMDFQKAGILSTVETTVAFLIVFLQSYTEKKSRLTKGLYPSSEKKDYKSFSQTEILLFFVFALIVFIFFLLPVISIILNSFLSSRGKTSGLTLISWKRLFSYKGFRLSILNTLWTSTMTSILSTVIACFYALFIFRMKDKVKETFYTFLTVIPLLPMAVSPVVLGLGIGFMFKDATALHLILAQSALFWPFAFKVIHSFLMKIPENICYSSRLLCSNKNQQVFYVYLPYIKKSILSAWGISFAMSAGDASLPLVLGINNLSTLSLYTYRLAGSYKLNEACCSGLILGFICMSIFYLTQRRNK